MAPVMNLEVAQQGIIQVLCPAIVCQSNSVDAQRSLCYTVQHSLYSHLAFLCVVEWKFCLSESCIGIQGHDIFYFFFFPKVHQKASWSAFLSLGPTEGKFCLLYKLFIKLEKLYTKATVLNHLFVGGFSGSSGEGMRISTVQEN